MVDQDIPKRRQIPPKTLDQDHLNRGTIVKNNIPIKMLTLALQAILPKMTKLNRPKRINAW
jgi:hypothetical protein